MPGMALNETFEGQPASPADPMLFNGLHRIIGAARIKAAALPQEGADAELVDADQFDKDIAQHRQ